MALNKYVTGSDIGEEDQLKPASKKGRGSWNEGLYCALLSPSDLNFMWGSDQSFKLLFPGGE